MEGRVIIELGSFVCPVIVLCASDHDEHRFLMRAYHRGLLDGSFVFITLDHLPPDNIRQPWSTANSTLHQLLKAAYNYVFQV